MQRVQFVAKHLLPPCDTLVVFWRQMQGEPVTMVAQIVEVVMVFKPEVEPRKRTFSIWQPSKRAKRNGPSAVLFENQQRRHTAARAVVELS